MSEKNSRRINGTPFQRSNFFISNDTLNSLLDIEENPTAPDFDFSVDLTEMPYQVFYLHDEEQDTLKVKLRLEIMTYDEPEEPEAAFAVKHGSDQANVTMKEENQPLMNALNAFYLLGRRIRTYVAAHVRQNELSDACPPEKGILIENKNGKLSHRIVEGRNRPDLQCSTLLSGMQMRRPYADEAMHQLIADEMGIEWKTEQAEAGDTVLMNELGMLYLNGDGETEPNAEKSFYWFRKMAETGEAIGMFNVGLFYAKGHGVKRDFSQAAIWIEKAAEAGDEDAPKAAQEYRMLSDSLTKAEAGDPDAQAALARGLMKLGGSLEQAGTGSDYEESIRWAQKAADQGCAEGIWILALAYEHGRGVKADKQKAIEYFRQGVELGHAACQHSLGCCYIQGDGVERNGKKAFELFSKSAEQGYGLAMKDLGRCYQFAKGTPGNMGKAIEWYEKSLEVLPDPELAQKVEIFKSLAKTDPHFYDDYPQADDDTDDEAIVQDLVKTMKDPELHIGPARNFAEYLQERERDAAQRDDIELIGVHNGQPAGVRYKSVNIEGTQYEGRIERIERVSEGDAVQLRLDPDNQFIRNAIQVCNRQGESLGLLPATLSSEMLVSAGLFKSLSSGWETVEKAFVDSVEPLSKRGKRAKRPYLYVTIETRFHPEGEAARHAPQAEEKPEGAAKPTSAGPSDEELIQAMQAFNACDAYEKELYQSGYLPDVPFFGNDKRTRKQGKEDYPRVMQKAAEGDERAAKICSILGWKTEKSVPENTKAEEKKEEKDMEKKNVSRLSIGGFFTMAPMNGLIMANVQKETFAKNDVVTTLFDTTGGRQMEMGFFGGIQHGMQIMVKGIQDLSNDDIKNIHEKVKDDDKYKVLAVKPGILVTKTENDIDRKLIYVYYIFTNKAILFAFVDDAIPQAETEHYDRLFASAAPEASAPDVETSKSASVPASPAPHKDTPNPSAGGSKKSLLQRNIDAISNEIKAVSDNLQQAKDLLNEDITLNEKERTLKEQWNGKLQSEQQKLSKAEKDGKQTDQDLAAAKAQLSSLGIFAFGKKKELRSRIETLNQQQGELRNQIKKLKDSVAALSRERDSEVKKLRVNTVQINQEEWRVYSSRLERLLEKYQAQLQKANGLLDALNKGKNVENQIDKWSPELMPTKPSVKEIKANPNEELADIILDVLARSASPLTVSEIMAEDQRLAALSNQKVLAILGGMYNKVRKVPDGRVTRFTLS